MVVIKSLQAMQATFAEGNQLWWCDLEPIWQHFCDQYHHIPLWSICSAFSLEMGLEQLLLIVKLRKWWLIWLKELTQNEWNYFEVVSSLAGDRVL